MVKKRVLKTWLGLIGLTLEYYRKRLEEVELERDAALADVETLTQANLEAALTEAARMRKDWAGDVSAAQEIVERKNAEIVELRRDLATARAERDEAVDALKSQLAPVICSRCGRDVLAKDNAAPAEPVAVNAITLQKIDALDIGERLIDEDGMMVGRRRDDYYVFKPGLGTYSTTNYDSTLRLYQELKAKA